MPAKASGNGGNVHLLPVSLPSSFQTRHRVSVRVQDDHVFLVIPRFMGPGAAGQDPLETNFFSSS